MKIKWHQDDQPHMNVQEKEGVTFLTYPALDELPGIVHGFSTRLGGVSEVIYATMNSSYTRRDKDESVTENFRRISLAMGFSPEDIVTSDQTHTANVRVVTEKDRGNGITKPRPYTDVDGMITNVPGLVLATFYADCVPLYFVDPVRRVVGLSHSGWRGTVARIGAITVRKMTETYGTDPKDLYAAIGPSICQDCYEVSEDVIEQFQHAFPEDEYLDLYCKDLSGDTRLDLYCQNFSEKIHSNLYYRKSNGKYQLNLWEANRHILLDAGIPASRISLPNLCTCCNPNLLFSHRATHGRRGNLAAFLGLK